MIVFDPRTIATPVYDALSGLRSQYNGNDTRLKEQKSQAVELYTYLSTWGMMRLKAEEKALSQDGKKDVVRQYFQCLQTLSDVQNLIGDQGLETLKNLGTEEYLGLTGLGLALSQEFAFWANAIYHDIKGEE
ncbi:MAG: hypothetical protein P5681_02940 [Limnospira sp. PMC 894.15]|uniref:hypothetical protein n=1 Tax=Limnospira TaxID=2596745 RepID=UPI0028E10FA1|nr:hypothetical protein [Limnospira sp. PMC 894.15]MDT9186759.1 hypothetical protein [Limnospira sp. PMC 894.15]MDY7055042.1 hypothetical protein [Limnospira fusiformis LS22]